MRSVAIHQPNLIPRLRVLRKIALSDVWVVLDNVQFARREWQNRARMLPPPGLAGSGFWLTAPVRYGGRRQALSEVVLASPECFRRKALRVLHHCFVRSGHYGWIRDYVTDWLSVEDEALVGLCERSTKEALDRLGANVEIQRASLLSLPTGLGKNERLVELCKAVGGTAYHCGPGGAQYVDRDRFSDAGIEVISEGRGQPDSMKEANFLHGIAWSGVSRILEALHRPSWGKG